MVQAVFWFTARKTSPTLTPTRTPSGWLSLTAATKDPLRKCHIVSGVMLKLKGSANAFFFLLQSDDGDLFKVTLDMAEDAEGNPTGEGAAWRSLKCWFRGRTQSDGIVERGPWRRRKGQGWNPGFNWWD